MGICPPADIPFAICGKLPGIHVRTWNPIFITDIYDSLLVTSKTLQGIKYMAIGGFLSLKNMLGRIQTHSFSTKQIYLYRYRRKVNIEKNDKVQGRIISA